MSRVLRRAGGLIECSQLVENFTTGATDQPICSTDKRVHSKSTGLHGREDLLPGAGAQLLTVGQNGKPLVGTRLIHCPKTA